jgi:hypothetical protein
MLLTLIFLVRVIPDSTFRFRALLRRLQRRHRPTRDALRGGVAASGVDQNHARGRGADGAHDGTRARGEETCLVCIGVRRGVSKRVEDGQRPLALCKAFQVLPDCRRVGHGGPE